MVGIPSGENIHATPSAGLWTMNIIDTGITSRKSGIGIPLGYDRNMTSDYSATM
jgi:hypothetical protein